MPSVRSPALAVAWRGGSSIPADATALTAASNRATWALVSSSSSTAWKCVHTPARPTPGDASTSRAAAMSSEPTKPPRPRPVSTSSSSAMGRLGSSVACCAHDLGQARHVAARQRDLEPRRLRDPGGTDRVDDEDGREHAGLPEFERLVDRRHAEPIDTGRLERECDRDARRARRRRP